jgi:hypothetical protein
MTKRELIAALEQSPHTDDSPVLISLHKGGDVQWHDIGHFGVWYERNGTTPPQAPILLHLGVMVMR